VNLLVNAPIFLCNGYARVRHLIIELHKLGVNIQLTPFCCDPVNFKDQALLRSFQFNKIIPDINLSVGIPLQFNISSKYNIGYTMFEANSIPKIWVECCNKMDEIWVPTEENKTVFELCGVTVPIFVFPYGVDHELFYPCPGKKKKFIFLSVGTYIDRKGWDILFSAFLKAFKKNEAQLIVKFDGNNIGVEKELEEVLKNQSIRMINNKFDDVDMIKLYHIADCFVLPTLGEAFCLPALEAVACGIPVIISEKGGFRSFLNDDNAWFIRNKGRVPASDRLCNINPVYRNVWFDEPDEEHLIDLMKQAVKEKRNVKVDERFFYKNIAKDVYDRLKIIEEGL